MNNPVPSSRQHSATTSRRLRGLLGGVAGAGAFGLLLVLVPHGLSGQAQLLALAFRLPHFIALAILYSMAGLPFVLIGMYIMVQHSRKRAVLAGLVLLIAAAAVALMGRVLARLS